MQVDDFNQFLTSAVEHKSLASMWQYFANYYTVIPLGEVTMDMCCFGSCLRLVVSMQLSYLARVIIMIAICTITVLMT